MGQPTEASKQWKSYTSTAELQAGQETVPTSLLCMFYFMEETMLLRGLVYHGRNRSLKHVARSQQLPEVQRTSVLITLLFSSACVSQKQINQNHTAAN